MKALHSPGLRHGRVVALHGGLHQLGSSTDQINLFFSLSVRGVARLACGLPPPKFTGTSARDNPALLLRNECLILNEYGLQECGCKAKFLFTNAIIFVISLKLFHNFNCAHLLYFNQVLLVQVGSEGSVPANDGKSNSRHVSCSKPSLHHHKAPLGAGAI